MPDDIKAQLAAAQARCRAADRDLAETPPSNRTTWQDVEGIEAERVYVEITIQAAIRRSESKR